MIRFNCNNCKKTLKVASEKTGKRVKCGSCGESLTVPESSEAPKAAKKPKPQKGKGVFAGVEDTEGWMWYWGCGTAHYGLFKKISLSESARQEAEQAGFCPCKWQVVKWMIIFFFPIIPFGTLTVMKEKKGFWSMSMPQCYIVHAKWDYKQIAVHYLVAYGWIVVWIALHFAGLTK